MKILRIAQTAIALAAGVLCLARAEGAVVKPLDLDALAQKSDLIVRGKALRTTSSWSGGRIFSVTEVSVHSAIKGEAPQVVQVRTPGGSVGDIAQKVSGAPEFAPGEEVILFLEHAQGPKAHFAVVGLSQGKFNVVPGTRGAMVMRKLPDVAELEPDGQVRPVPDAPPVTETEFVDRIRKALVQKGIP